MFHYEEAYIKLYVYEWMNNVIEFNLVVCIGVIFIYIPVYL